MILVDTSVWVDYFNDVETHQTDKLEELLGNRALATGDLILTELLRGFRSDRDFAKARDLMLSLDILPLMDAKKAIRYADYYRTLRSQGITIRKTADLIIAGYCLEEGHQLLFSDRDFVPFVDHFGLQAVV